MPTRPPPRPPQGSAALAITVMLLLLSTIAVLYLNRSVLFEQRTVANQMQATQAHEVAEAGVEWATGMLNAPFDIGANCNLLTTTNQSFRKRYVLTRYNAATNPSSEASRSIVRCAAGDSTAPSRSSRTCWLRHISHGAAASLAMGMAYSVISLTHTSDGSPRLRPTTS